MLDGYVSMLHTVRSNRGVSREDAAKLWENVASLEQATPTPICHTTFAESYHCLFSQYRMEDTIQGLSGNGAQGRVDTRIVERLAVYHSLLFVPTVEELQQLRTQLEKMDISKVQQPRDVLLLSLLRCFLYHPLIDGYVGYTYGEAAVGSGQVPPLVVPSSPAALPSQISVLSESLFKSLKPKATPSVTQMYNAWIVLPFTVDQSKRAMVESILKSPSPELELIQNLNYNFHISLFPGS